MAGVGVARSPGGPAPPATGSSWVRLLCASSLAPSPISEPAPDTMSASDPRDPKFCYRRALTRDGAPHAR